MKRFIEINDDTDTSDTRVGAIAEQFAAEPFNVHAVLDDGDALIVEVTEFGIVITSAGFVVADQRLPDETVEADVCGQSTVLNRRCFVSREIAVPAVVRFLHDLDTPADMGWVPVAMLNEWKQVGFAGPPLQDSAIIELWRSGRRVDAVREYRRAHGLGLKEAMEALQSLAEGSGRTSRCT